MKNFNEAAGKAKKVFMYVFLTTGALFFNAGMCDDIENATSKDVNLRDINLSFDVTVGDGAFQGDGTLSLAAIGLADLEEYSEFASEVNLTDVTLVAKMKSGSGSGTKVSDLRLKATQVGADWTTANYKLGDSYNDAKLTDAFNKILLGVCKGRSIIVSASGNTDAQRGGVINIKVTVSGTMKAKLL